MWRSRCGGFKFGRAIAARPPKFFARALRMMNGLVRFVRQQRIVVALLALLCCGGVLAAMPSTALAFARPASKVAAPVVTPAVSSGALQSVGAAGGTGAGTAIAAGSVGSGAATATAPVQRGLVIVAGAMFVVGAALAAAETAITTLWPWKVRELAEKEGQDSPFAILEKDLTRFLTTILVATTSATIFSTAIATEMAGEIFGAASVGYVTAGMTVVFLFAGEILPKALAVHSPQRVARVMVPVINFLSVIVYPIGKLLAALSTLILRFFKLPMESDLSVSEEELRLIVAGADRSGSIEKYESQIIKNVLDMEETAVRNVMCPRVDMVALEASMVLTDLLEEEAKTHYSRMPVYEGSIDNIIGVVLAKSLLRYLNNEQDNALGETKVGELMDPALFVPESMSVWTVLEEMRKRRVHLAIVVDEYGGTAGLVSLEDIIEEVVGEIYDEDDDVEAETHDIEQTGPGTFLIDGQAELEKVGDALLLTLTDEDLRDYGTISGFLCARMGGIPEQGDLIVYDNIRFTVAEADDRRILNVCTELLTEEEIADLKAIEAEIEEEGSLLGLGGDDTLNGSNGVVSAGSLSRSNGPSPPSEDKRRASQSLASGNGLPSGSHTSSVSDRAMQKGTENVNGDDTKVEEISEADSETRPSTKPNTPTKEGREN